MTTSGDEIGPALIDSGLEVLAEGGGAEFSLRRAGERIGLAGSAASHRFGNREGFLAAVGQAALDREVLELERFCADLPAIPCEVAPLASTLVEWLDHRARWSRRQARTICELVLMSYRYPSAHSFNQHYLTLLCAFLRRLCPGLPPGGSQLIALFLIAEAPNWLLLADEAAFKMLSAETAARIVALAIGAAAPTSTFWLEYSHARPELSTARLPNSAASGTKQRILDVVVRMIEEEGPQAVTHRAISANAGVSLSSLMHHFGKRGDLLRAGIQELFRQKLSAKSEHASLRTAAAPYELALYALQDPFLAPLAAAVRRKQGAAFDRPEDLVGGVSLAGEEIASMLKCSMALLGGVSGTSQAAPEIEPFYAALGLAGSEQNRRRGTPAGAR
jgi:AcrR family transcriptional regulator